MRVGCRVVFLAPKPPNYKNGAVGEKKSQCDTRASAKEQREKTRVAHCLLLPVFLFAIKPARLRCPSESNRARGYDGRVKTLNPP